MNGLNVTNAGSTQDTFILPALPVRRLPVSQDRLDGMKLVRNHTISIILRSGKNILADMMLKFSMGYANLDTRQTRAD